MMAQYNLLKYRATAETRHAASTIHNFIVSKISGIGFLLNIYNKIVDFVYKIATNPGQWLYIVYRIPLFYMLGSLIHLISIILTSRFLSMNKLLERNLQESIQSLNQTQMINVLEHYEGLTGILTEKSIMSTLVQLYRNRESL